MANHVSGQGMKTYMRCLETARINDEVGVNKHIRQPQPETSRIGFVGKTPKAKKTTMNKNGKMSAKERQVEEIKAILRGAGVPLTEEQTEEMRLRAKIKAAEIKKLADALKVTQFSKNVMTVKNLKNSVG